LFFFGRKAKKKNKEPNKKERTLVLKKQLKHNELISLHLIMKEHSKAIKQMMSFLEQL